MDLCEASFKRNKLLPVKWCVDVLKVCPPFCVFYARPDSDDSVMTGFLWAFEEEEYEESRKRVSMVYNHTDWITLKSPGPTLTNTAAYWHSKSTGWLSALLCLPSSTHTHTSTHTPLKLSMFECHWAVSGWIITLGLSEQSASCPKSCQHPTYPKTSTTMACAYGIFAGSLPDTL